MQIPEIIGLRDKNTSPDERRNFLQLKLELVDSFHYLSIQLTLMLHRAYLKRTSFAAEKPKAVPKYSKEVRLWGKIKKERPERSEKFR